MSTIGFVGLVLFLLQSLAGGFVYDYVMPSPDAWIYVASVAAFVSVLCMVFLAYTYDGRLMSYGLPSLGLPMLLFAMNAPHGQKAFVILAFVCSALLSLITASVAQIYGEKEHFGVLFFVSMPVIGYPIGGIVLAYRAFHKVHEEVEKNEKQ